MSDTIWKWELEITDRQTVDMPAGAEILAVDSQEDSLCVWARVQPGNPRRARRLAIYGTGHVLGDPLGSHLASVVMPPFVWHVFDEGWA